MNNKREYYWYCLILMLDDLKLVDLQKLGTSVEEIAYYRYFHLTNYWSD